MKYRLDPGIRVRKKTLQRLVCVCTAVLVFLCAFFSYPASSLAKSDASKAVDNEIQRDPSLTIMGSELTDVKIGAVEQENLIYRDENGTPRGIIPECLSRIAGYALVNLNYIWYDDVTSLISALRSGEIDMCPDMRHNEEHNKEFLFTDDYLYRDNIYICVRPDDDRFTYGDVTQINRMKLGGIEGSSSVDVVYSNAKEVGESIDLTLYPTLKALENALSRKEIDGSIISGSPSPEFAPLIQVDLSPCYICFNKDKWEIKIRIDSAMNRLFEEDPLYSENLQVKYGVGLSSHSLLLTEEEREALLAMASSSGVRVAAVSNDSPYFFEDSSGVSGIIPDYYDHLAEDISQQIPGFGFEYVSFGSEAEAIEAVKSGDCALLAKTYIDPTDAAAEGLILTASLDQNPIAVLTAVSSSDTLAALFKKIKDADKDDSIVSAAVIKSERIPVDLLSIPGTSDIQVIGFDTLEECADHLEGGLCDCFITTLTRATYLTNHRKAGSYSYYYVTDMNMDLTGAVTPENASLGSVISKASSCSTSFSSVGEIYIEPPTDLFSTLDRMPTRVLIIIFVVILALAFIAIFGLMELIKSSNKAKEDEQVIKSQRELIKTYEYDSLTGLLNKGSALRIVNDTLKEGEDYTVVITDLMNFRIINETFGHDTGDLILRETGGRLKALCESLPTCLLISRFSGDEFLIFLHGAEELPILLDGINTIETTPISIPALYREGSDVMESIWLRLNVGYASSDGTSTPYEIVRNADIALSEAKTGKESLCYYTEEMKTSLNRKHTVRNLLIDALMSDGFYMLYQPKIDIQEQKVCGFEALVRMKDNSAYPDEFIPIAESSGFIRQLGRLVTRLVIRQLAKWREEGIPLYPVSINYSSSQIGDTEYVDYLLYLLNEYDIPASLIEIEITESLLMNESQLSNTLFEKLTSAGIRLSIDDFGTGYSSLKYLVYIPADTVKIDKSLIDNYLKEDLEQKSNAFICDILNLVHDLKKTVVAEGVEEKWQAAFLRTKGCDMIQGYFYSKPLLPDDVTVFLEKFGKDSTA